MMSELETNDDDLTMKLNGYVFNSKRKPAVGIGMALYDVNGNKIQETTTDANGRFSFKNIQTDLANRIEVIMEGQLDSVLFIADSKGRVRKLLQKNSAGAFDYKLLDIDKTVMGEYTIDDPWLKVIEMKDTAEVLTIVESILYATNNYRFDSIGQRILDKTIGVLNANSKLIMELSSHTDSRANDKYNLKLSVKRAEYAVDYIVSKGIDKSRLIAIGYGESKLLNKCVNDFNCSEEEHAQNRRTEFKITYKK